MKISITKAWLIDTGERAGFAFIWAFGCVWLAPVIFALANGGDVPAAVHGVLVTSVAWKAAVAGFAPAFAIIKAALATIRNESMSPASFAPPEQPGQALAGAPPAIHARPRRRRRGEAGYSVFEMCVWIVLAAVFVAVVVMALSASPR